MKKCSKCNISKSRDSFRKHKCTKDGIYTICNACVKEDQIKRREIQTQVTKEDANNFISEEVSKGTIYKCKTCEVGKLANAFYYRRDYGKVYIPTKRCKECEKNYQRERIFGLDRNTYDNLLKSQEDCCSICGVSQEDYSKQGYRDNFAVDHCHSTGKIRGLLCDKCNRGLGFFNDNTEHLKSAVKYLEENMI